jgi:hypothetical protein
MPNRELENRVNHFLMLKARSLSGGDLQMNDGGLVGGARRKRVARKKPAMRRGGADPYYKMHGLKVDKGRRGTVVLFPTFLKRYKARHPHLSHECARAEAMHAYKNLFLHVM